MQIDDDAIKKVCRKIEIVKSSLVQKEGILNLTSDNKYEKHTRRVKNFKEGMIRRENKWYVADLDDCAR